MPALSPTARRTMTIGSSGGGWTSTGSGGTPWGMSAASTPSSIAKFAVRMKKISSWKVTSSIDVRFSSRTPDLPRRFFIELS